MAKAQKRRPIVMVSSTVYGIEELRERIFALLTQLGYEVWCSHSGTMPVKSDLSTFENCLEAVEKCDLFLSIITPHYGSGRDGNMISITHQELIRAIELKKPRWLLAHDRVVFARLLLNHLQLVTADETYRFDSAQKRAVLTLKKSGAFPLDDLRVIDMYEAAIQSKIDLKDRSGNWVHRYMDDADALRFATNQFQRFQEIEEFIKEHFEDPDRLMKAVDELTATAPGKKGDKP